MWLGTTGPSSRGGGSRPLVPQNVALSVQQGLKAGMVAEGVPGRAEAEIVLGQSKSIFCGHKALEDIDGGVVLPEEDLGYGQFLKANGSIVGIARGRGNEFRVSFPLQRKPSDQP